MSEQPRTGRPFRSGFATVVGRPNVGKSTLVNALLGRKVSIVSDKVNTTRQALRGILHLPDAQVVFVDTPGLHKPRTLLGTRLNERAADALEGVDVALLVLDANAEIGRGDAFIASRLPTDSICVVNKVDRVDRSTLAAQLARAGVLGLGEYFPVSAVTGEGLAALTAAVVARLPPGPPYYPTEVVRDSPEAAFLAELVRERLLDRLEDELPHAVATRVTEWDWPRVRVEILVARDSQKGIVIGRGGSVLRAVGAAVREEFDPGMYLELFVKVDRDWQRRAEALDRLGL